MEAIFHKYRSMLVLQSGIPVGRPHADRFTYVECPVCGEEFKQYRSNMFCCSKACFEKYKED